MTDREARSRVSPQACFIRSRRHEAFCGAILRRLSPSVLTTRVMWMVYIQPTSLERLHLPASLRSTGVTPLRRYYGCSDSCLRSGRQTGLPASFVESSSHSASNHPLSPRRSDLVSPSSLPRVTATCVDRTPPFPGGRVIWASPLASRLTATTGRIEFALAGRFQPVLRTNLHLRLLSTSPRGDAVTFSYGIQIRSRRGLPPR
jgi:hypothetical protein